MDYNVKMWIENGIFIWNLTKKILRKATGNICRAINLTTTNWWVDIESLSLGNELLPKFKKINFFKLTQWQFMRIWTKILWIMPKQGLRRGNLFTMSIVNCPNIFANKLYIIYKSYLILIKLEKIIGKVVINVYYGFNRRGAQYYN